MVVPGDVRVVFMGSPGFAVPSLDALMRAGYPVAAVVTQPDRPAGRGGRMTPPEVKERANELGIPVLQPESLRDEAVQADLRALTPDVIVVAAYGKILPKAVLAIPTRGCVNVHASLLPRWRGASPIAAAILAGDSETGVTIMEMAPKMDAGAIISQVRTEIPDSQSAPILEVRLAQAGAGALVAALPGWYDGSITTVEQDEAQVTFCSLVQKSDGYLRATMTAVEAERAVRAYQPWPGASVGFAQGRLAIWQARVVQFPGGCSAGETFVVDKEPAIAFCDAGIVLEEVQKPGGHRMSGAEFVNGLRGVLPRVVGLL